ncbi:hypothetical protein [Paenibacillus bouchesdurhonensis]|uniref:hypothetical protein n=1 Tax=Paenibacillus bouchesdurhonensis TaxID=1870990 RepID=UPI000DA639C4|nr:hypothetical protein [Paenibacillus bouchesdurhonensis]
MKTGKKPYYVSVAHRIIQEAPNQDSAEFRVLLDEEDLVKLNDKMAELSEEDIYTFRRAPVPYKSADHDAATEQFNDRMIELYTLLYQYGDEHARRTIIRLGVLGKLQNHDYNDPGYNGKSPLNK